MDLPRLLAALKKYVFSKRDLREAEGYPVPTIRALGEELRRNPDAFADMSRQLVAMLRDLVERIELFDARYQSAEDQEWLMKLAASAMLLKYDCFEELYHASVSDLVYQAILCLQQDPSIPLSMVRGAANWIQDIGFYQWQHPSTTNSWDSQMVKAKKTWEREQDKRAQEEQKWALERQRQAVNQEEKVEVEGEALRIPRVAGYQPTDLLMRDGAIELWSGVDSVTQTPVLLKRDENGWHVAKCAFERL